MRIGVLGDAHQAEAGERRRRLLRHRMDVGRQLVAVERAAERDRALRRLRVGQAARRIVAAVHALAGQRVVLRLAAEILRGDLLQLQPRVGRARQIRARHRVRRLAADRHRRPRNVLGGAAPVDDDLVPRHRQRRRRRRARDRCTSACRGCRRPTARTACRPAGSSSGRRSRSSRSRAARRRRRRRAPSMPSRLPERALRSSQLNSAAPRSSASFTNALVMCAALAVRTRRAVERLALRRVDPADRDLIEPELLRRLGDHRLHDRVGLHRSRRALLRARRRVGQHRERRASASRSAARSATRRAPPIDSRPSARTIRCPRR